MTGERNWSSSFSTSGQLFVSSLDNVTSQQSATVGPIRAYREPTLLLMRMETLQLDPTQVKAATPDVFRVLARVCDYCQCKVRCERDLACETAGRPVAWEAYCPNVFRLSEMVPRAA
jgi:hypothetical protein